MPRIASCTCGQLNAQCMGEPVRISVCHCFDWQRRTGSAFGVYEQRKHPWIELQPQEPLTREG
jgi:hypothetical protein